MTHKRSFNGVVYENNQKSSNYSPSFRGHFTDEFTKYSLSAWDKFDKTKLNQMNRGFLIENPRKFKQGDPDLIGKIITPKARHFYIGAWKRVSQENVNYYSMSLDVWNNQFDGSYYDIKFTLACKEWKEKESR